MVVESKNGNSAELIVVLEGAYKIRINHAFFLAKEHNSKRIFYPGLADVHIEHVEKLLKVNPSISLDYEQHTESTIEEALRTKLYCKENNISSLIVVTSPYHSLRTFYTFKRILKEVTVYSKPVPEGLSHIKIADMYWNKSSSENSEKTERALELFRREQIKITLYWLFLSLQPLSNQPIKKLDDLKVALPLDFITYYIIISYKIDPILRL